MFVSILSSGSRCLDLGLETSGTNIFPFILSVLMFISSFFCLHSGKKKVKRSLSSGKRWLQFFVTKIFGYYFLHLF